MIINNFLISIENDSKITILCDAHPRILLKVAMSLSGQIEPDNGLKNKNVIKTTQMCYLIDQETNQIHSFKVVNWDYLVE